MGGLLYWVDSAGAVTYRLADGLGSTAALADGSGTVTDTYTYDVFGAVHSHNGPSTSEWTFTGEQNDPNGLEYLRARYYDPGTGRFLSRDPWPANKYRPKSLHRYAYTFNNPINFVDPAGLDSLCYELNFGALAGDELDELCGGGPVGASGGAAGESVGTGSTSALNPGQIARAVAEVATAGGIILIAAEANGGNEQAEAVAGAAGASLDDAEAVGVAPPTVTINHDHANADGRIDGTGVSMEDIDVAIRGDILANPPVGAVIRGQAPTITVDGVVFEYHPHVFPDGTINVGYFPVEYDESMFPP